MIYIDAHVHIYECFDLEVFFDSALSNFQAAAKCSGVINQPIVYMLLLAEGKSCKEFQRLAKKVETKQFVVTPAGRWTLSPTDETLSLIVQRNNSSKESIILVDGRQIATAEGIEVLSLFCSTAISDTLPLKETITIIRKNNGIPVIPWGAGKWLGKRGRILREFLSDNNGEELFLGDNGGRPVFWSTPNLFFSAKEQGFLVLPGSDPLPLPQEASRVGSFGLFLNSQLIDMASPAQATRELLRSSLPTLHPFGRLQNNKEFLKLQLQLRLKALFLKKRIC